MANVGSPALSAAFNPFDGGVATLTSVYLAPLPSGGDDYAMLQSLIDTYNPQGIRIRGRKGVYLTSQELQILTTPGGFEGAGINYLADCTTIRAIAPMRSVIFVQSSFGRTLANMVVDANQQATSAILLRGSGVSRFENVVASNGKIDGWLLDNVGGAINDTSIFSRCWGLTNGTIYLTAGISSQYILRKSVIAGTATITNGGTNVVIAGGPDLTTFGFRSGDILRVGSTIANSFYGFISSVTANTFVLQPNSANLPTQTLAGQDFAVGLGDGFHEVRGVNNNINIIEGGLWRGNAGVHLRINGLFGDTIIAPQFDNAGFFSVSVGDLDNASAVFGLEIIHPYTEVDGVRASFFLGNVVNVQASTVIGPATDYLPANTLATGTIRTANGEESIQNGTRNNFIIQIKNNGGTLQARFLSDVPNAGAPAVTVSLTSAPGTYTNIPTVSNVVGFGAAGCGVVSGFNVLAFDTSGAYQSLSVDGKASIEVNETGTAYTIALGPATSNVNGVTKNRLGMYLYDLNGVNQPWTAITAGKTIAVRVEARIKK